MNYREKLPQIKELELESDNLQQILEIYNNNNSATNLVVDIQHVVLRMITSLSSMYRGYESAIKISHINGTEKEIASFIDICNFESGKLVAQFSELFNLSNIGYHDIKNYYDALLVEKKLKDSYFFDTQILQTAMQFGRFNNIGDQVYNNPTINRREINLPNEPKDDFCRAFKILNPVLLQLLSQDLWELITSLSLALGELNNENPDFKKYHSEIMEAWLRFIKCMDMVGHNWLSIGRVFTVYNYSTNGQDGTNK